MGKEEVVSKNHGMNCATVGMVPIFINYSFCPKTTYNSLKNWNIPNKVKSLLRVNEKYS